MKRKHVKDTCSFYDIIVVAIRSVQNRSQIDQRLLRFLLNAPEDQTGKHTN